MRSICTLLVVCGLLASASAGIVHLKDGSTVEGDVKKSDDGWVVVTPDGKSTLIPPERVSSIQLKPQTQQGGDAVALGSLRRAAENLSDIRQILDRCRAFQKQYAGTPSAAAVQADIDLWEQRLADGLVKQGDKWVTRDQQQKIRAAAVDAAGAVRELLLQGKAKEAATKLAPVLADDPQNPAALYLRGVMLLRQEQLAPARKAFEAVAAALPDHGATLNNIAVIHWRQNAFANALNFYDQAMSAAPGSMLVLNNVAEALHALPPEQRSTPLSKRVVRRFNDQDNALQDRLKARGLFRWGSSWVTAEDLDKLQEAEKRTKDKLDELQTEFDDQQDRISDIDREIDDTERSMHRIEAFSYTRDSQGNLLRLSYPRVYYELQHDLQSLKTDRANEVAKLERVRKKARAIQQSLPKPRYADVQQPVDVEGAPLLPLMAAPPQTRPSTATAPADGADPPDAKREAVDRTPMRDR